MFGVKKKAFAALLGTLDIISNYLERVRSIGRRTFGAVERAAVTSASSS